jgi:hypothetical protein
MIVTMEILIIDQIHMVVVVGVILTMVMVATIIQEIILIIVVVVVVVVVGEVGGRIIIVVKINHNNSITLIFNKIVITKETRQDHDRLRMINDVVIDNKKKKHETLGVSGKAFFLKFFSVCGFKNIFFF